MTDPDLIGLFVEPLEAMGTSYMITGGVASVIYGDPRFTRDVDVVMELPPAEITALVSAFDPAAFYVPPAEALEKEVSRTDGGHFNVIHRETALRADIYLAGEDPLIAWAFDRRMRLQVGGAQIWVAPIEYVILRKLEYYEHSGSDRHLRDVAMMLRIREREGQHRHRLRRRLLDGRQPVPQRHRHVPPEPRVPRPPDRRPPRPHVPLLVAHPHEIHQRWRLGSRKGPGRGSDPPPTRRHLVSGIS